MQGKTLILNKVVVQIDMVVVEGLDPCSAAVFGRQVEAEQCGGTLHAHLTGGYAGAAKFGSGVLQISGRCQEEEYIVKSYLACDCADELLQCLVKTDVDILLFQRPYGVGRMAEVTGIVCQCKQVRGVVISKLHTLDCCKSHLGDLVIREGGGEIVPYLTLSEQIEKRAETLVIREGYV